MGDFYELIKGIFGLAVINMGLILSLNLRLCAFRPTDTVLGFL